MQEEKTVALIRIPLLTSAISALSHVQKLENVAKSKDVDGYQRLWLKKGLITQPLEAFSSLCEWSMNNMVWTNQKLPLIP